MTIALTGSGSLFVRLGHLFGPAGDLLSLMGGAATTNVASGARFPARFTTMNTDLANGTAIPKEQAANAPYSQLAGWQSQQSGFFQYVKQHATGILKAMVNLDKGLPEDATLDTTTALLYLWNQMVFASSGSLSSPTASILQATLSIGAQTAGANTPAGNPIIFLGTKNSQGQSLQLVFPETITFTVTKDSNTGGATSGNETVSFAGLAAAPNSFSHLYATSGSGCTGSFSLVDGSKSLGTTGNLLNNSDFATTTTTNIPDNWTIVTGAATTDILAGTGTGHVYTTSGGSLGFIGNAGGTALKAKLTQSFNTTPAATVSGGGTSQALVADTQYAFNFWAIVPAGVPAAGIVRVSLQDGAGNILNDDFGTANSTSFNLNTLAIGNAWVNCNGSFRTPANLTTQTTPFKLVFELTTALSTGSTAYFGRLAVAKTTPLYDGGPPCVGFSGNAQAINGLVPDVWTSTITNTYGQFALFLDKVFGTRSLTLPTGGKGLIFPYAASPTIADSLIS